MGVPLAPMRRRPVLLLCTGKVHLPFSRHRVSVWGKCYRMGGSRINKILLQDIFNSKNFTDRFDSIVVPMDQVTLIIINGFLSIMHDQSSIKSLTEIRPSILFRITRTGENKSVI